MTLRNSQQTCHSFCIAAPHSGSGKTSITLGLSYALKNSGLNVQTFKSGPDYVDPTFLEAASEAPCYNLDTWMMGAVHVQNVFTKRRLQHGVNVIEGVMGLFDGFAPGSLEGTTADICKTLDVPVILVVDAKGMAGSIAPLVKGFCDFHPEVRIAAVIANQVGSPGHTEILRDALAAAKLPPLLGGIPTTDCFKTPERHLGLVPYGETMPEIKAMAEVISQYIDLELLLECTETKDSSTPTIGHTATLSTPPQNPKRIGIAKDEAFLFYYQENLHALQEQGWELVEFSPMYDSEVPENLDWLYLGGGYPELFAKELSKNTSMIESIQKFVHEGGQIYGECGGYVYLCKTLQTSSSETYDFCNLIPYCAEMHSARRALGYRFSEIQETHPVNQWFSSSIKNIRGHEFHWTSIKENADTALCKSSSRHQQELLPVGFQKKIGEGFIFASYLHLYWANR